MFEYLLYSVGFLLLCIFIRLHGHLALKEAIIYRYRRWRKLNNLVSTQHKTAWTIFYNSLKLLCQVLYLSFLQYMNSSLIRLGRNAFLVTYTINGKIYKMIVRPVRGPSPVLQVISDNEEDITLQVLPYLGPRYDWHKTNVSFQETFGSKRLTFEIANGDEVGCTKCETPWLKTN